MGTDTLPAAPEDSKAAAPQLRPEFVITQQGKPFVLYAGLLTLAHDRGLKGICTALVQAPTEHNGMTAIVHATVDTEQGSFMGLGDANPGNVSRMMVPHLIRMAETRAKARALRDAVNVGMTSFEELGETAAVPPAGAPPAASAASAVSAASTGECSPEQFIAIGRLHKELGRASPQRPISAAEAARLIVTLQTEVREVRARQASGSTSPTGGRS